MPSRSNQLQLDPAAWDAAIELTEIAARADSLEEALRAALPRLAGEFELTRLGVYRVRDGNWEPLGQAARGEEAPESLLAAVLDEGGSRQAGGWAAAALAATEKQSLVLAARTADAARLSALAAFLGPWIAGLRRRGQLQSRTRRLEAILEVAGSWDPRLTMDELLNRLAETACRLIGAERASIFLWNRAAKTLIGRPALGVEGGELRIPDDKGIVGQVVRTGEPRRVDRDLGQEQINREVDRQLKFQTHTLLAVPLRTPGGKLLGAFELINKVQGNFTEEDTLALAELAAQAAVALENSQEFERLAKARDQFADQAAGQVRLIGQCPAVEALRSTIARVADTELAILVLGENGTGKEVVAQSIHYQSGRRREPIVAVNCAAITETLLESELFGHEKGAFTDAHEARPGKFEAASGGTLFLDEIGDMSLGGQARLLRVLEEKVVVRVGGSQPIHTDTRVIAATNQNLATLVRERKFREDLFFRLNVVTIELPPLRERGDDVLLLAEHFLRDFAAKAGRKALHLTASARKRLLSHAWPGNIRELRNLMERMAYLSLDDQIAGDDLDFIMSPQEEGSGQIPLNTPLTEATQRFQIDYIQRHIDLARGNVSEAARRIGLHRSNLYRKMKQLGMNTEDSE